MNAAPKRYDEEFYIRELEGQEKRLRNLKSRQENRQLRFEKIRKGSSAAAAPRHDTATKVTKPRSQERGTGLENAVLRALEDPKLELPCSLDAFVDRLDNRPHHGDVAAILRTLWRKDKHHKKEEDNDGSVSVELENADYTRKMVITAVHGINKESTPSKRPRIE